MPFGSVLARLTNFRMDTADGQTIEVKNNLATRTAIRIVGIPHIGLRIRASMIMAVVHKGQPENIIDAGSGNGIYVLELGGEGFNIVGLEIEDAKVGRVNQYLDALRINKANVTRADITHYDHVIKEAGMVICSDVLEHIGDDKAAMETLRSLVSVGGVLVITVPRTSSFAARVENNFGHVRVGYSEEDMRSLLGECGFEVVYMSQFFKACGRFAWRVDRWARNIPAVRALMFWPLFAIARMDAMLPKDSAAGGLFVVARVAR